MVTAAGWRVGTLGALMLIQSCVGSRTRADEMEAPSSRFEERDHVEAMPGVSGPQQPGGNPSHCAGSCQHHAQHGSPLHLDGACYIDLRTRCAIDRD